MAKEQVGVRLGKLARELNVSVLRLVEFLRAQGKDIEKMSDAKYPNLKVDTDCCELARQEFAASAEKQRMQVNKQREREAEKAAAQAKAREAKAAKAEAQRALAMAKAAEKAASEEESAPAPPPKVEEKAEPRAPGIQVQRTIDLDAIHSSSRTSRGRGGKGKKGETPAKGKSAGAEKPKEAPAKASKPAAEPAKASASPKPVEPEKPQSSTPEPKSAPSAPQPEEPKESPEKPAPGIKVLGQIDLDDPTGEKKAAREAKAAQEALAAENAAQAQAAEEAAKAEAQSDEAEPEVFRPTVEKLEGPKVLGKLDAAALNRGSRRKPEASATPGGGVSKRRRRRISVDGDPRSKQKGKKPQTRQEISMADVEEKLRETQSRIASKRGGKTDTRKYRAEKKSILEARRKDAELATERERSVLRISEFVSVNELSVMMDVPVTSVIETCMNMGLMVSINYRLDAESLALVADEFGFKVEFISVDDQKSEEEAEEDPALLESRPPVFVVMGHVDHGKTTLMDAIRSSNTVASEAGGITQHISAYSFSLKSGEHKGRKLTLIDTPGHESFTAMRARGAKLTDVAIIVVAADDGVMPQTIEAINHASVMGANIVFAITKIDSPKADPERVKTQLADHNYLVEEWGGKYQSQDISALKNQNVDLLLEKVLLEADMLELKANPHKRANATVLESMVDKGLGHCVRVLVHSGTLRKGDSIVSAGFFGRVKTLFDDRRKKVKEAGPSMPVTVVGLNGAPQAGDPLVAVETDKEARSLAQQQGRIRREMEMRSRKHITLDEIGRRIAIGNFQELNVIVKGDVVGSVEALSDALLELSTDEIRVNVIHGGVGQITESDVTLAASAEAIIVGFQVRPSHEARRKAENEQIDIRLYSIIYDAIEEIKSAMEGMLMPEVKEDVLGTAEVMEVYKISKVGTVAGCVVREGKILRGSKVHIIRDGVVIYTSELTSLKRFKDEAKEVNVGMDCGMAVKGYNDIKVGDFIESFKETEVHRTLE